MNPLRQADSAVAGRMMEEYRKRMAEVPEGCMPGEYGCTVLLTAQGNLYSEVYPFTDEGAKAADERLLEQLAQKGDTEVAYVLCMPAILIPWWIRTLLPELDPRNMETRVLLPQEGDPRYRTIRECQPPKK